MTRPPAFPVTPGDAQDLPLEEHAELTSHPVSLRLLT